jgi:hypothetical protein
MKNSSPGGLGVSLFLSLLEKSFMRETMKMTQNVILSFRAVFSPDSDIEGKMENPMTWRESSYSLQARESDVVFSLEM